METPRTYPRRLSCVRRLRPALAGRAAGPVVLFIVLWFVWRATPDKDEALRSLIAAPADWRFVLAILCAPANLLLEAIKYRVLARRLSLRQSLAAVSAGAALGFVLPFRLGEYLGRAAWAAPGATASAWGWTLAARLAQAGPTFVTGGAAALFLSPEFPARWTTTLQVAAGAFLGTGILTSSAPVWAGKWQACRLVALLLRRSRFRRWLLPGLEAWRAFAGVDTRQAALGALLSWLRYALFTMQYVLLLTAFGCPGRPEVVTALVALFFAVKSAGPAWALAELGVREALAVSLFGAAGFAVAPVVAATFILYVLNTAAPAVFGALFAGRGLARTLQG